MVIVHGRMVVHKLFWGWLHSSRKGKKLETYRRASAVPGAFALCRQASEHHRMLSRVPAWPSRSHSLTR